MEMNEQVELLRSLQLWLDGMSRFIAVAKSEWSHASVGYVLMAQKLGQHSRRMSKQIGEYADKLENGTKAGSIAALGKNEDDEAESRE